MKQWTNQLAKKFDELVNVSKSLFISTRMNFSQSTIQ